MNISLLCEVSCADAQIEATVMRKNTSDCKVPWRDRVQNTRAGLMVLLSLTTQFVQIS